MQSDIKGTYLIFLLLQIESRAQIAAMMSLYDL